MQDLVNLIERFGFPTIVCLWFMWKERTREHQLRDLTQQIARLTGVCAVMSRTLDLSEDEQQKLLESDRGGSDE